MERIKIFVYVSEGGERAYFPQDRSLGRLCDQDGIMFQPGKPRNEWGIISFRDARRGCRKARAKVGDVGFNIIRNIARHPLGSCVGSGTLVSFSQLTIHHVNLSKLYKMKTGLLSFDLMIAHAITDALGFPRAIINFKHIFSFAELKFR